MGFLGTGLIGPDLRWIKYPKIIKQLGTFFNESTMSVNFIWISIQRLWKLPKGLSTELGGVENGEFVGVNLKQI